MKTSILICTTCLIVTGCSAQLRFPSLSSALSSLTGYGGAGSSSSQAASQSAQSSPYSGLVRDYGRNLMMAMSSIYPTLFKPPQAQQQQGIQQAQQSPFEQFASSQQTSFASQQSPSFSFGGSTFSISPSLPFGSLTGASQQQPSAGNSHSPFGASFGSSINSPSSFGPLSSGPFSPQSMPSFAPASSYNSAFEAANGGPAVGSPSFSMNHPGLNSIHSSVPNSQILPQSSNSYASLPNFNSQHDSAAAAAAISAASQSHSPQASGGPPSNQQFGGPQQAQVNNQQYRPELMSIAASAPVPSSNSYSNYGNIPSVPSQQAPAQSSSYQQPSYR